PAPRRKTTAWRQIQAEACSHRSRDGLLTSTPNIGGNRRVRLTVRLGPGRYVIGRLGPAILTMPRSHRAANNPARCSSESSCLNRACRVLRRVFWVRGLAALSLLKWATANSSCSSLVAGRTDFADTIPVMEG